MSKVKESGGLAPFESVRRSCSRPLPSSGGSPAIAISAFMCMWLSASCVSVRMCPSYKDTSHAAPGPPPRPPLNLIICKSPTSNKTPPRPRSWDGSVFWGHSHSPRALVSTELPWAGVPETGGKGRRLGTKRARCCRVHRCHGKETAGGTGASAPGAPGADRCYP